MSNRVTLPIDDNQGYSPEQIDTSVTLYELLEAIKEAIEEFGEDATVVLDNGQRYGARFGSVRPASSGHEWFQEVEEDSDDESKGRDW